MSDSDQDGWITKSGKSINKSINMYFYDSEIPCQQRTKLKLPPSSFPSSCVCGHLNEFRKIDFCRDHLPGKETAKIAPVNIKLKSFCTNAKPAS